MDRIFVEKKGRHGHVRRPPDSYTSSSRGSSIDIRIGNRQAPDYYNHLRVTGPDDAALFRQRVDKTVRANPKDPLVMCVLFILSLSCS